MKSDDRPPEYISWMAMIQRCTNKNTQKFVDYGGRGIQVCERWRSFKNFLADMGARPNGTTIDRNDVNGNYEPGNCRWATDAEQSRNKRNSRIIDTPHGPMVMCDAEKASGLSRFVLAWRIKKGWKTADIFGPRYKRPKK